MWQHGWAHLLHVRVGWPACVSVILRGWLKVLLSTSTGHDCFVYAADATSRGVALRGLEVVEGTRTNATCAGVHVLDIVAVRVAIVHIAKSFDWVGD